MALLNVVGQGTDLSAVTAGAGDVLAGKVIVGADGDTIQGGIESMAGQTVTPGSAAQTLATAGKYLTGNIVIGGKTLSFLSGTVSQVYSGGHVIYARLRPFAIQYTYSMNLGSSYGTVSVTAFRLSAAASTLTGSYGMSHPDVTWGGSVGLACTDRSVTVPENAQINYTLVMFE